MTSKKKTRARELQQKSGMPYQAALNVLNAGRARGQSAGTGEPEWRERGRENRRAFRGQSLRDWAHLVSELLDGGARKTWTQPSAIVTVLQRVALDAPLNHCFMPRGGGLDLQGAAMSGSEAGCIELDLDGSVKLLKPAVLELVSSSEDPLLEWSYFRLDLAALSASGVYDDVGEHQREELVELAPGRYVERSHWDAGYLVRDGEEEPFSDTARVVTRLLRGSLVFFAKGSTYNTIDTYDGRHAQMPANEFAVYIRSAIQAVHNKGAYGRDLVTGEVTTLDP